MISLKKNSFCGTHEGAKYWLNTEICGIFCGCVTYVLVLFGEYAMSSLLIGTVEWDRIVVIINLALFNFFSWMAMYSHFKAMTTDPGAVPKDALPLLDDQQEHDYEAGDKRNGNKYRKYCKRCSAFKPIRAHHCSICRRCIVKMDHHCPWVNNCVGLGNHKLFLQFLTYVNIISVHAIIILIVKYANCTHFGTSCGTPTDHLFAILCFIESLLFGLFTCCMKCDQISNINNNSTQIDRMQNIYHDAPVEEIHEVLGTDIGVSWDWSWVLPTAAVYPSAAIRDQIFGYTLPLVQQQQQQQRRSNRRHSNIRSAAVVGGDYYLQEDNDDQDDDGNIEMRPLRGSGSNVGFSEKLFTTTMSTSSLQSQQTPLLPAPDTGAGVGVVVDAAVAAAARSVKSNDDDFDEEKPNYSRPIEMMFTDQFRHVDQRHRQLRRNIPPFDSKEEEISAFDSYGVNTPLISTNSHSLGSQQNGKGSPPLSGREGSNSSDSISDRDRYYTMRKRLP